MSRWRLPYPSFGFLVETGSTALSENWFGMTKSGSQNHDMLGALDEWLWSGLAGIGQAEDSVAFRDLVIEPERPTAWSPSASTMSTRPSRSAPVPGTSG